MSESENVRHITNKELYKIMREQQDEIESMRELVKEMTPKVEKKVDDKKTSKPYRRADRPETGGWFIESINPNYWEKTAGVQFTAGQAIVYLETPNADHLVDQLEHDFKYKVTPADDDTLYTLQKALMLKKKSEPDLVTKLQGGV